MRNQNEKKAAARQQLADSIEQLTRNKELLETPVPGLTLYRREQSSAPATGVYEPSICLIAQGAKQVWLGEETFVYDTEHYLFSGLHLPAIAQVIKASRETPYLALRLTFDYRDIARLLAESEISLPSVQKTERGMTIGKLTLPLINAFQRLLDLLDEEQNTQVLSPLIQREIFYRLLVGEQGGRLSQLTAMGTQSQKVARVVSWLKDNFKQPLRINDLAEMTNMGVSTLHHHFRIMTAMSPLQYQKQLRLQHARTLMLTEHVDAASASFSVGYESPSQFSREYSRQYGTSPARDILALRQQMSNANDAGTSK